jgi:DNA-directed RNA polymerase subunit RPC12/RpoP
MEFFRHCPQCGRRFHIKLEGKTLDDVERTSRPSTVVTPVRCGLAGQQGSVAPPQFLVQEGKPIVVDIEEFSYSYKCGHCGHEWTEKRVERHRES